LAISPSPKTPHPFSHQTNQSNVPEKQVPMAKYGRSSSTSLQKFFWAPKSRANDRDFLWTSIRTSLACMPGTVTIIETLKKFLLYQTQSSPEI